MLRAMRLIAFRELWAYLSAPGFWISLASVPLFMLLGMSAPLLSERAAPVRHFVILDSDAERAARLAERMEEAYWREARSALAAVVRIAAPDKADDVLATFDADPSQAGLDAAIQQVELFRSGIARGFDAPRRQFVYEPAPADTIDGLRPFLSGDQKLPSGADLFAAFVIRTNADGELSAEYWSENIASRDLRETMSGALLREARANAIRLKGLDAAAVDDVERVRVNITDYKPSGTGENGGSTVSLRDRLPAIVGFFLAFLLFNAILSSAAILMSSIVEERGNKILDTLLTTAPLQSILLGKLLGVASVSLLMIGVWGLLGSLVSFGAVQAGAIPQPVIEAIWQPELFLAFVLLFIAGYVVFGSVFLAIGSTCETLQESQSFMGFAMMIIILPMMMLIPALQNPDAGYIKALTWVPIFTPFFLLVRLPTELSLIEWLGPVALLLAFIPLVLWLSGKLFRAGALGEVRASEILARFGQKAKTGAPLPAE